MDTFSNKKTCKICKTEKTLKYFYANPNTKDGYLNECIDCFNQKRKNKYKRIRQKEDEFSVVKQVFTKKLDEYSQRILLAEEPDEIRKIRDEHMKDLDIYELKLSERLSSSTFNLASTQLDEFVIKAKIQSWFLNKKKAILVPDNIVIIVEKSFTRIQLPNDMKLNLAERSELIRDIMG
jgi:hypothetical protein